MAAHTRDRMDARILLVEDDPSIREVTAIGLRNAGFTVETAADGVAGLERFATGAFDLVLLDVMLPRLDGLEVCRAIRRTHSMSSSDSRRGRTTMSRSHSRSPSSSPGYALPSAGPVAARMMPTGSSSGRSPSISRGGPSRAMAPRSGSPERSSIFWPSSPGMSGRS
jgi:Response regulator receiver domain